MHFDPDVVMMTVVFLNYRFSDGEAIRLVARGNMQIIVTSQCELLQPPGNTPIVPSRWFLVPRTEPSP